MFWAQGHLSTSKWMVPATLSEADPSSALVPTARAVTKLIYTGQPQLLPVTPA